MFQSRGHPRACVVTVTPGFKVLGEIGHFPCIRLEFFFFMNIHRKNLVKEKNNSMVYKFVSIDLVFPLEFQD